MRISTLLVALTLLAGFLRAGAQYFYCPMMNVVVATHCCATRSGDELGERNELSPAIELPDCCERRQAAALPAMDSTVQATVVAPAPFTSILDPTPHPTLRSALGSGAMRATQRAGPPDVGSGVKRAVRLQVFLI